MFNEIYIWKEFLCEAGKEIALPDSSSRKDCGSEQYHTCLHLYSEAILEADKVG